MDLDDPKERREFRKRLLQLGIEDVRYQLKTGKLQREKAVVATQWIADTESGAAIADELIAVAEALEDLKSKFVKGGNLTGHFLQTDDQAIFERLIMEATDLLDERFGKLNDYTSRLTTLRIQGNTRFIGGPSVSEVTTIAEIIRGAVTKIQRRPLSPTTSTQTTPMKDTYIDLKRLEEIRNASSVKWDFKRLLRMCEEVNAAYEGGNLISVAMLVRGILDHVPPVFGKYSFNEVASNYGGKSFKGNMAHLQDSMRQISDTLLHQQIRSKESLPTATQVDVRRDLDVLLAEVARLA